MNKLPRVMVLKFCPVLTHSVWMDFHYRNRTWSGLIRSLQNLVKSGEYVGYRLIAVNAEVIGVTPEPKRPDSVRAKERSKRKRK